MVGDAIITREPSRRSGEQVSATGAARSGDFGGHEGLVGGRGRSETNRGPPAAVMPHNEPWPPIPTERGEAPFIASELFVISFVWNHAACGGTADRHNTYYRSHAACCMPTTEHFKCVTCEFSFDSPAGLSQHVAVAHQECAVCGDTFEDTGELDDHTQNEH